MPRFMAGAPAEPYLTPDHIRADNTIVGASGMTRTYGGLCD